MAGSVVRWEQGDNRVVQATGGTGAQAPVELVIQLSCSFDVSSAPEFLSLSVSVSALCLML